MSVLLLFFFVFFSLKAVKKQRRKWFCAYSEMEVYVIARMSIQNLNQKD